MSEPEFSARVRWSGNDAEIECYLWEEPQGEYEDDLLELSIKPGKGNGKPHNLYMNLDDAWALVNVIAQCALRLQLLLNGAELERDESVKQCAGEFAERLQSGPLIE